ncbi:MAG: restriction endonuclease subunit S [Rickettsiales bacterium]|nr:restriction endonuclease subunit S [Rickettsiales bacterium]
MNSKNSRPTLTNTRGRSMQCFVTLSDELREKRIDPYYYSPSNRCYIAEKTKFPVLQLSEVANLSRGKFSHRPRNDPRFFDGKYPFIQTGDVVKASQTNLQIQYSQTLNDLGLSVSKIFDEKIIVITIAANIGDTAILDYPACFPDSLVAIKPKNKDIKLEYLNIYLRFLKKYLESLAPQAAQRNINLQQLSPTPIAIPPLHIQEQIIAMMDKAHQLKKGKEVEAEKLLNSIDDYVLTELGIKLPEVERKMCFVAMSNELESNRFDPSHHFEKFFSSYHGKFPSKTINALNSEGKIICKKGSSITKSKTFEGNVPVVAGGQSIPYYHNQSNFENAITISASGAYAGYIWYHNYPIWASDCTVIQSANENEILTQYLYTFLKSQQKAIYGRQRGAGQPHVYLEDISDFLIPLPSLEIQKKITSEAQTRMTKAEQLKEEAKSLLQKAKDEVERMILGE